MVVCSPQACSTLTPTALTPFRFHWRPREMETTRMGDSTLLRFQPKTRPGTSARRRLESWCLTIKVTNEGEFRSRFRLNSDVPGRARRVAVLSGQGPAAKGLLVSRRFGRNRCLPFVSNSAIQYTIFCLNSHRGCQCTLSRSQNNLLTSPDYSRAGRRAWSCSAPGGRRRAARLRGSSRSPAP